MTITETTVDNGVNVEPILGTRDAISGMRAVGQFKYRARNTWINGTHSQTTVEGFFGVGEEQKRRKLFTFDADHPEVFAAEDNGATPVEYVLVGLASWLTAGVASVATNRGIQLNPATTA
tara:strand:- start:118 stop:477 length:360 start_codon:yes stop_codon:yes gene_type:complete